MRIGIDARELTLGCMTGIGRFLCNFLQHAVRTRPQCEFILYGNQHTSYEADPGTNITLRRVPERVTLWWDQVVLPRLASQDELDLFLSPYMKGPYRVECPLIVTIHDLLLLRLPEYTVWIRCLKNWLRKWSAARVAGRADRILTVSEHARRDIESILGVRKSKIVVVPNAVGESFRPVEDPATLAAIVNRYGLQVPYILYLGNFKPHKNVSALMEAFASVPAQLRDSHQLVLAGDLGPFAAEHRQLATDFSLTGRAHFAGRVAEGDMPGLYSGATLFVFPSLYEGFGLPPLEAMACGTAVVSSNRSSLPEVVGDAACLVDPDDVPALATAIHKLIEDGGERRRMEARGLERAAGFRSEQICELQMRIVEAVVAGDSNG